MMRVLRLFGTSFSLSLRQTFAYRVNLCFDALIALLQLASAVIAIGFLFHRTGLLAGWRPGEMLVLVGTYSFMTGLRSAFIDPSIDDFSDRARDGRLDACLLQPAPSVLLATCTRHAPLVLVQSVLGIGVIAVGLRELGTVPSPAGIAGWILLTGSGLVIGWATTVALACLVFWAPRLSFGVVHSAAWEFGRYPVDIYGRSMRLVLTYVFPMAVVTTWPARSLTRGPSLFALLVAPASAAVFTALALLLWGFGIRRYSGATS
ncbi:MAG TPA: ABC-2 family transporter protein [Mycobacteriales bacterium]|nr:ABC-2 family transporter protein [Mycobacteriales bacterium]